jgi:hypothetical protein
MRDGQLAGELPAGATEEEILRLATGARVPGTAPEGGHLIDSQPDGGSRVPEDGSTTGGTA